MMKKKIEKMILVSTVTGLLSTFNPVLAADTNLNDNAGGISTGLYTEWIPLDLCSLARHGLEDYASMYYTGLNPENAASEMILGTGIMVYEEEDGILSKTDTYYFPVYEDDRVSFILDIKYQPAEEAHIATIKGDIGLNALSKKEGKFIVVSKKEDFYQPSIEEVPGDFAPFTSSILVPAGKENESGNYGVYRFYNSDSGEHLYTINTNEKKDLTQAGWKTERVGWFAPKSGRPVFRLYNPNSGDHHYTSSENEKKTLTALGWKDEGRAFYGESGGENPVYRLYNPNVTGAGNHHYTTSQSEAASLIKNGWKDEGIGWYAQLKG